MRNIYFGKELHCFRVDTFPDWTPQNLASSEIPWFAMICYLPVKTNTSASVSTVSCPCASVSRKEVMLGVSTQSRLYLGIGCVRPEKSRGCLLRPGRSAAPDSIPSRNPPLAPRAFVGRAGSSSSRQPCVVLPKGVGARGQNGEVSSPGLSCMQQQPAPRLSSSRPIAQTR
jgi:hypothetical protein